MGSFSSWSYTNRLTFWSVGTDKFGQPVFGEPYTVNGTWASGGNAIRGLNNVEFVPRSRYWFEIDPEQSPQEQWRVMVGEHTGEPPRDAEVIRRVDAFDNTQFEAGSLIDYVVYT